LLLPSDIPIGIPLPWSIADSHGRLLLHKGYVIARQITVNSLFANCSCQIMPEEEGESVGLPDEPAQPARFPLDELVELSQALKSCMDAPESYGDFTATVLSLAGDLQRVVAVDRDLALATVFLPLSIEKRFKKILDIAIVSDTVATTMRMTATSRRTLTAALLTLGLQVDSPEVFAAQRLRQLGVTDSDWLNTVMQYHELKQDSQQPTGLSMEHLILESRLVQLADSYTQSLSPVNNNASMASYQLMRDIFRESGKRRDPVLGGYFIKALGSYPTGSQVKLCNGETGVVIRRTDNINCPIVMSLANGHKQSFRIPIKRDTNNPVHRIATTLDSRDQCQLDPYLLWGYLPFKPHG
jgi:hypothetical protein